MIRWNNHLKTIVLLGALSALLVGIGGTLAPGRVPFFVLLAVAMNIGAYFFSDRLVLRMHGAREYLADETGARISGDPLALASALGRLEAAAHAVPSEVAQPATASLFIVNPLAGTERMARRFSTHPSTTERIERLRTLAGTPRLAA